LAGISLLVANFWGFLGKMTPKRQMTEIHLLEGHFLAPNCVFWAIAREIISIRLACTGAQKKAVRRAGRQEEKSQEVYITCSAVALSRVLRTTFVPYGNIDTSTPHSSETSQVITMKFCKFYYVRKTNTCAKFSWNPPASGRSKHTWNIHFLWLIFLPSCLLFSCAPAQAKRIVIISRTMAQKTQFGVRKWPSSKCFSLIWRFGGYFAQKDPTFCP